MHVGCVHACVFAITFLQGGYVMEVDGLNEKCWAMCTCVYVYSLWTMMCASNVIAEDISTPPTPHTLPCRVKAARSKKGPGYAIDSLTVYDDNPFADTEGYQVQENPGASGLNPVFMGAGDIKGQLANLEKALEDYQSGDYYESGENSDKKPLC